MPIACSSSPEELSPAEFLEENSTLLEQLRSYDSSERNQGIARIRKLGKDQGTALILYVLSDPEYRDYRGEIVMAWILARWEDQRAIPYLLQNLQAPDDGAVRIAVDGLLSFGDHPRIIAALEEMLQSPGVRSRTIAAGMLAKIGTRQTTEMLGTRLKSETDVNVRAQMLVGVIAGKHPSRKQFLIDALTDADEAIRELAWNELRKYRGIPDVDYSASGPLEERAAAIATLRIWLKGRGEQ